MDKPIPFFSVIVCTYNRAHILLRALNSLTSQTFHDWDCIIIDDASEDNTKEVISPFIKKHGFQYIKHSHRGCAMSKNAGMEAAKGQYITFLDSDDEYAPQHLSIRHDTLIQKPEIDLLHSNVKVIGNRFVPDKDNPSNKIDINECTVGGTFVIKRHAIGITDRFQDIYSDDSSFLERFLSEGKKVLKINSPTYIYHRDSEDSMCSTL